MQLPPLHPRCRCAIDYREVEKPKPKPLTSPQGTGNVGGKPISPAIAIPAVTAPEVVSPQPIKPVKPEPEPANPPQENTTPDEAAIRAKLEETRAELKIKGELIYPPPEMDFSDFTFDAEHTQGDKHPHDVTEEEARKFIADAYFALHFKGNDSLNYFGREGAAYVQLGKKKIRTAFKADEYNPKFKKMIEVYENAQREG